MLELFFFTTAGCHLCECAETMLYELTTGKRKISWIPVEISDSGELIERYGCRIPVLGDTVSSSELQWPFSLEELGRWVDELIETHTFLIR